MNFIAEELQQYVEAHTQPETPLLSELARETYLKTMYPRMLSGHLQGRVLSLFSRLMRPRRILEIGTFTGYSAICLTEGLAEDGLLITFDIDPEVQDMAQQYFVRAGLVDRIDHRLGNAIELIPTLDETFDLVFIDGEKQQYLDYYQAALPHVRSGGLILVDNVLWSGHVMDPEAQDPSSMAVKAFNDHVSADPQVIPVLLPVRDGLYALYKK